jgi:putative DNA primase/helicase
MRRVKLSGVLNRLEYVKTSGSGNTARCPSHDDHRNSLSIGKGRDGRVLLYCHAGCDIGDILEALGLEMKDLYPAPDSGRRVSV